MTRTRSQKLFLVFGILSFGIYLGFGAWDLVLLLDEKISWQQPR
jgi:hypothetical protein